LCDAVIFQNDGDTILISLEYDNLSLVPLDLQRKLYRYPHLFAEFLHQRLFQTHQADQIASIHRRASDWYESNHLIIEAVNHALAAEDRVCVVRTIEANVFMILDQGEIITLMRWLDAIPVEQRQTRPWLSIAHLWILVYADKLEFCEETLYLTVKALHTLEEGEENL